MTHLDDALAGVTRLGFDTSPIIYYVEASSHYGARVQEVFRRIVSGTPSGVTSVVTLAEVLVHPLRQGNAVQYQKYHDLLLTTGYLDTMPITADLSEQAADLRARYNLRTADALQVAVAIGAGCEAFLTNDTRLSRVTELRILVLDELTL